jgi:lipoprotein-releasing system permease protein
MFEWTVAGRYLWMARRQRHTAFLSLISMLGLAVGVATLLISLALLSGLQGQIKARLIASSPQLLIEPTGRNTIQSSDRVTQVAGRLGIQRIRPLVAGMAWGANEAQKRGRPIRVRSYRAGDEPAPDSPYGRLWKPKPGEPSIRMARDAAAALGLNVGNEITLIAPRTRLTPFGPVPVWRKFRIVRIIPSTTDERSGDAALLYEDASAFFGTAGEPTSIEMYGAPIDQVEQIQAALSAQFPTLLVKTWKEINRPLFLALRLEKVVMFATISLIIFVASLNLISSLSMLIVEKRSQVGVLRTLGASERSILLIFIGVGLLIGLVGTALGNAFGLGISWAANRYHFIPLPRDIYFITYLPFTINQGDVIGVNAVAVLLSVLATWYPARVASRLDPITAIREE